MPTPPADANQLVDQVVATAAHGAARDVANQLIGLLWHHQQAADPEEAEALRAERRAVRARQRLLRPGGEDVNAALEEWGARVLALRER
jgi:hypothetical protein